MGANDLESSIILRDESSPTIQKFVGNTERMNAALIKSSASADRTAASLRRMSQETQRTTLGGLDLGQTDLLDASDSMSEATDKADRLKANLEALGQPQSLRFMQRDIRRFKEDLSDTEAGVKDFSQVLERSGAGGGQLAKALDQIGNAPFLRNLPIGDQAENLGRLLTLLPRVSTGTLALAGSLGLLGGAVFGAYQGFGALLSKIDEIETQELLKAKISFFGEPDQVIDEFQSKLDNRLTQKEALNFLLKVDPSSALAEMDNFGAVVKTVQGYADAFGADWKSVLDVVIQAINAGDGEALERLGIIKDAELALRTYAENQGKTVQQLTPAARQQALINAVLAQNLTLMERVPNASDQMTAAQERMITKLGDTKSSIADFAVSLFAPQVENAASWWTSKLDGITQAVDTFEENLKARTEINKLAGSLTDDQVSNWDDLNASIDETNNSLNILRDQSLAATLQGNDQEASRIDQQIDELDRKLEQLKAQRDAVLADFKAGKDVVLEEIARPAAPAGSQVFLPTPGAILDSVTGGTGERSGRTVTDLTKDELKEVIDLEGKLEQQIAANRAKANEIGESIISSAIDGDANRVARMKDLLAEIEAQITKDEQTLQELLSDPALSLDPTFVAKALGPQIQADAGKVAQSVDPQLIEAFANTYGGIREAIISGTNAKSEEVQQGIVGVGQKIDAWNRAIEEWRSSAPSANQGEQVFLPIINSTSAVNEALDETSQKLDLVVEKFQSTAEINASGIAGEVTAQIDDQVNQLANNNPQGSVDPQLINALAGTYGDLTNTLIEGTNQKTEEVRQGIDGVKQQILGLEQAAKAWDFSMPTADTGQIWNPMIQNSIELQEELDATEKKIEDVEARGADFEKLSIRLDTGKNPVEPEDQVTSTRDAVAAYNGLTNAQLDSAEASQISAAASEAEAIKRSLVAAQTREERDALVAAIQLRSSQFEVTEGLVATTGELTGVTTQHLIALAKVNAQTGDNVQVAGLLFDSISGLPVAFETAGLSATQLKEDLVGLMDQLDNLQNSAVSAGFSIANRLIPSLGIAGSLRQAQAWAQQAAQIREDFNNLNAGRLQEGRDPLGAEFLDTSLSALQSNWNAQATDMLADMEAVGEGAGSMASATEQAAERMNSALDGIISGVLQDSTNGLIPLDDLLPREDAVDEPARRMADVAVKGFTSPWFEGLKNLFPEDVLAGGEDAIKRFAAEMVKGHQNGLTTALYDVDAAAAKVIEKIQAKQNQNDLIAQVREKVKGLAGASDLDIMDALGIDTSGERAAQASRKLATDMTLSFEQVQEELRKAAENESPIVSMVNPKEEDVTKIQGSGTGAISLLGEAMVTQAGQGNYGSRSIQAITTQLDASQKDMEGRGKKLAGWLGDSLLKQFKEDVPKGLLDILVIQLAPLMAAAAKAESERTGGGGTQ